MDEKLRLAGNTNQLLKLRRITFRDGKSGGVQAIEFHNQSGLYLTCIEDQCLNLFDFSYQGVNFAFQSKNGLVSNRFFNGGSSEFGYYWPAGMMYTCGLTNVGPGVVDEGNYHAEHGRIGMMPAEDVSLQKTEKEVILTGTVRDSLLCGYHMELKRTLTFPIQGKEIRIDDQVTNLEALPAELMLLYHFNFGYPLLAPGSRVVKGEGNTIDLIHHEQITENYRQVGQAQEHKKEELYCHTNTPDKQGFGYAAVVNDKLRLGGYIKYKLDTLPLLIHWKNMCAHDYCVGLEPSNTYIMGRKKERENGTLPVLKPYETQTFHTALGVLEGEEEIFRFEKMLKEISFEACKCQQKR